MRIIEEPKSFNRLWELSPGDVFCYDGDWYMKIEIVHSENSDLNAVDLDTGILDYISPESEVDYQDVELRVRKV